ncbi:hypothetical protein DMC30DRAFT_132950 [Rhodotorula diobovata]|uniref:Uncharacterized protein n=1 Tax=Rhodotorula diobovata TaxID=5288 RepID=A0A5C5FLM0_9BASI|nr:hypothetical protein DMC30DRAFT_450228 [Rhodotorula diobovata]TNY17239.1 hypothetical protein DMC30DRAFT_132950 [Rhodotorula diobovata]
MRSISPARQRARVAARSSHTSPSTPPLAAPEPESAQRHKGRRGLCGTERQPEYRGVFFTPASAGQRRCPCDVSLSHPSPPLPRPDSRVARPSNQTEVRSALGHARDVPGHNRCAELITSRPQALFALLTGRLILLDGAASSSARLASSKRRLDPPMRRLTLDMLQCASSCSCLRVSALARHARISSAMCSAARKHRGSSASSDSRARCLSEAPPAAGSGRLVEELDPVSAPALSPEPLSSLGLLGDASSRGCAPDHRTLDRPVRRHAKEYALS